MSWKIRVQQDAETCGERPRAAGQGQDEGSARNREAGRNSPATRTAAAPVRNGAPKQAAVESRERRAQRGLAGVLEQGDEQDHSSTFEAGEHQARGEQDPARRSGALPATGAPRRDELGQRP